MGERRSLVFMQPKRGSGGGGGAKKNDVRELGDHYLHVAKSENQVLRIGKALADRPKSQRSRRA